jgi:hypothetical protein
VGTGFDRATLEHATTDVRRTVEHLIDERNASVIRVESPSEAGFGNVLIELRDAGVTVTVTRDRGQWMLDVQVDGQDKQQFDLIHAAMTHKVEWPKWTGPLPDQLPVGVSWFHWLPLAVDWLRHTPGAAEKLRLLGEDRSRQIFG